MRARTLLYDPYAGGHHPQYLGHIVRYWRHIDWPTDLQLAVPRETLALDAALSDLVEQSEGHVTHIPVTQRTGKRTTATRIASDLSAGLEVRRLLKAENPECCLLMYFDHLHIASATLLRGSSAKLAGIYFRPDAAFDSGLRMALLRAAVTTSAFETLFVLDQSATERLRKALSANVVWLPDGIDGGLIRGDDVEIPTGAKQTNYLLFGSISSRKGIHVLARAATMLDADVAKHVHVTVAGPHAADESEAIRRSIRVLSDTVGSVSEVNHYLSQREINTLCRAADIVLAPYVDHSGSSNVLVHAAAAGRPVIATDSALVGELVRTHRLGATVGERNATDLARLIEQAARKGVANFDPQSARKFAEANTDEAFAKTVYREFAAGPVPDSAPGRHNR